MYMQNINFKRKRNIRGVTNTTDSNGAFEITTIDLSDYPFLGESLPVEINHSITGGTDVHYLNNLGVLGLFDEIEIMAGDSTSISRIPLARLEERTGEFEQNARARLVTPILTGRNTGTKVVGQSGDNDPENDWCKYVRHNLRNELTASLRSRLEVDQKTWVIDLFEHIPKLQTMLAEYGYIAGVPQLAIRLYWHKNINERLSYTSAPSAHSFTVTNYVYVPVDGFDVSQLVIPKGLVWLEPVYDRFRLDKPAVATALTDDLYIEDEPLQGLYVDRVDLAFIPDTDSNSAVSGLADFVSIGLFEAEHRVEVNNMPISGKTLRDVPDIESNALRQRPLIGKMARNPVTRFQAIYAQNLNRLDAHYRLPYPSSYRILDPEVLNEQVGRKCYIQHVIGDQVFSMRYALRYRPRGTENQDQWDDYTVGRLAWVGRKMVIDENVVDVGYATAKDMLNY